MLGTRQWLRVNVSRYIRLCNRHEYPMSLSQARLVETVYRSFPEKIERVFRFEPSQYDLTTIWPRAMAIEEEFKRAGQKPWEPATPAEEAMTITDTTMATQAAKMAKVNPNYACKSCGEK